ncbi:hypothetical protein B0H17DRAFT_1184875 [Mycena rosella]|uniref:Uncharacterized protein n=1 Tax=Mycena rosella TaxID=1033263 RepID=A0AAD7G7A0_MYCRO|nr:hypothetical protein B0H17DRAFT_1184875 [Mycena rosella]
MALESINFDIDLESNEDSLFPMGPFDSRVGVRTNVGARDSFITSHAEYIPTLPHTGQHEVALCADYRYGRDDPTCCPQMYSDHFPHFAAIPKRAARPDIEIMWYEPTRRDFDKGTSLASHLGRLAWRPFQQFLEPINRLSKRVRQYQATQCEGTTVVFTQLHETMTLDLERVQTVPATYERMRFEVASIQRCYLELEALLDYTTVYHRKILELKPFDPFSPAEPLVGCMGVFTNVLSIAQLLHKAGLPYWLIRPTQLFDRDIVRKTVKIDEPLEELGFPDGEDRPVVYSGHNTADKMQAIWMANRHMPWCREVFNSDQHPNPNSVPVPQASRPGPSAAAEGSGASSRYSPCCGTSRAGRYWTRKKGRAAGYTIFAWGSWWRQLQSRHRPSQEGYRGSLSYKKSDFYPKSPIDLLPPQIESDLSENISTELARTRSPSDRYNATYEVPLKSHASSPGYEVYLKNTYAIRGNDTHPTETPIKKTADSGGGARGESQKTPARESCDKFQLWAAPEMPPSIPAWSAALAAVNRSQSPQTGPNDRKYIAPEPALLVSSEHASKRQRLIHHWMLLRSAFVALIGDGPSSSLLLFSQEWRDILDGKIEARGHPQSRTGKCRPGGLSCTDYYVEEMQEIVWDVAEINFHFELAGLDRRASGRERWNKVQKCFVGKTLLPVLDNVSAGLGHISLEERHRYNTPSGRPPLIDRVVARREEDSPVSEMEALEKAVAQYYTQSFYDLFGQAAVIPMRLDSPSEPRVDHRERVSTILNYSYIQNPSFLGERLPF